MLEIRASVSVLLTRRYRSFGLFSAAPQQLGSRSQYPTVELDRLLDLVNKLY